MGRWTAIGLFFFSQGALAFTASPAALRLEDKKTGNLLLGAESSVIESGEVFHTVLLLWGRLDIYGQVGEVLVLSGHVVFHEGAQLKKSLVVMGGSYEALPGAAVKSESIVFHAPGPLWRLLRKSVSELRDNFSGIALAVFVIITCLLLWLFAYVLFRAFPNLRRMTAGRLSTEWPKNLLVGFAGALAVPVFFVLLLISLFGIVFLPLYLLMLGLAGFISYSAAACWAGHRLWPAKTRDGMRGLSLLLGIVGLQLFWMANVWWSALPPLLIWTLGWGALLRSARMAWK